MNCERVKSEVPDYLVNSLSQESSAAIQSHLVMCGACRQELATLESAWTRRWECGRVAFPALGCDHFYAMLEEHQQQLRSQSERRVTLRTGWRMVACSP